MLFHIKHTHTWETCPYHDSERAKETFGKAIAGIMDSDVGLVGAYADPPAHTTFLLLEATSVAQLEASLAPVIDMGWAETRPVVDLAELMGRIAGDD